MSARGWIRIMAVGRMKERFYADAQAEYVKRLSRYGGVTVEEVPDEPAPERLSEKQRLAVMELEGGRLLQRVGSEDWAVALALDGQRMESEAFALLLGQWRDAGRRPVFILGGSLGLSAQVMQRANMSLSLSPMTFCHPLARIVLLEQVYRALRIDAGAPYHK